MDMILLGSALKVGFDIYLELQTVDQKFKLILLNFLTENLPIICMVLIRMR